MRKKELYNGRKIPTTEVLSLIDDSTPKFKSAFFEGAEVNIGMLNMRLFAAKGCKCTHCDLTGEFFRVERMGIGNSIFNEWHLNLYGYNNRGQEVMMTKDHIHAKSKGGTDEIRNLQPMCETCNTNKGDLPMDEFVKRNKPLPQPSLSKYMKYFEKVSDRMQDRYAIQINKDYFDEMNGKMKVARIIKDLGNGKTIREVFMHGRSIKVFYNIDEKCIISAMEDKPDAWFHTEMVPSFGRHDQIRARQIYKEVLDTATAQMKILDTPAETAKYIQGCAYSSVMFCIWKSPEHTPTNEYRLSKFVWSEVHKIFKSLNLIMRDTVEITNTNC